MISVGKLYLILAVTVKVLYLAPVYLVTIVAQIDKGPTHIKRVLSVPAKDTIPRLLQRLNLYIRIQITQLLLIKMSSLQVLLLSHILTRFTSRGVEIIIRVQMMSSSIKVLNALFADFIQHLGKELLVFLAEIHFQAHCLHGLATITGSLQMR